MTDSPRRGRRAIASIAALTLGGTLISSAAAAAPGDGEGIAALEVQIAQVAAQAQEAVIGSQLANEDYLQSQVDLEAATQAAAQAQAEAEAAAAELEEARRQLGQVALAMYRDGAGGLSQITPYLSAESFGDAMARTTTLNRLGAHADSEVQSFEAVQQVATTLQERAEQAVATQEAATEQLGAAAQTAEATASAAQTQLAVSTERRDQLIAELAAERDTSVEEERARQDAIDAERQTRQEAAAQAEALAAAEQGQATAAPAPSGGATPTPSPAPSASAPSTPAPSASAPSTPAPSTPAPAPSTPAPAPSTSTPAPAPAPAPPAPAPAPPAPAPAAPAPKPAPAPEPKPAYVPPVKTSAAQTAIAWARTQIGKPYGWGATGPNAYDCSGLTMRAYQQAGISLPRTSKQQYNAGTRIPLDQVQPGDLVFWSNNGSASGIYHLAIYSGNGMRIQAPYTGAAVQEVKMYYANIMPFAVRL
ncbi:NlpC/P60 family protein [Georgenia sp. AZ-5]|uniref:C40 family peptidase n=1 Tax=Georgenia sp. AZ-5 TaxID=3367526 RepID=UPI003755050D